MKLRRTHGMHNTRTYGIWRGAKKRCENPRDPQYRHYGGRGIKFCSRWAIFENFLADMGEAPEGLTLGRQDNEKNYEPSNCKWETMTRQQRNKRTTTRLTIDGREMSLMDWADEVGLQGQTIRKRIQSGWSVKEAVYGKET